MCPVGYGVVALEREEKKHIAECKKQTDKKAMMITAKSIVQSRRAKEKMYMTRATMNTLVMQLSQQVSFVAHPASPLIW